MSSIKKQVIASDRIPKAIGPYSAALKVGSLVFCSGQVGFDPQSGQLVEGGIEAQSRQALTNLSAVLDAAGLTMDNVVKTTVFLQNMNDFPILNAVYAEFFSSQFPARSTIAVASLPKNALVEIEAIAIVE